MGLVKIHLVALLVVAVFALAVIGLLISIEVLPDGWMGFTLW